MVTPPFSLIIVRQYKHPERQICEKDKRKAPARYRRCQKRRQLSHLLTSLRQKVQNVGSYRKSVRFTVSFPIAKAIAQVAIHL